VDISSLVSGVTYSAMMKERFGDVCVDPMTDLVQFRQISSMIEYHESCEAIINRFNLSEQYMLNCFLGD